MKFKNIKKEASSKGGSALGGKKAESPSNSRTIPERFKFSLPKINLAKLFGIYRGALKVFVVFIFLVAVIVVGYDFQKNLQIKHNIDSEREALTRDLSFWEDFISKRQNYPEAYFQASILEYKLGNTSKAKMYVEKGLSLDPNSESGIKIEKFLDE